HPIYSAAVSSLALVRRVGTPLAAHRGRRAGVRRAAPAPRRSAPPRAAIAFLLPLVLGLMRPAPACADEKPRPALLLVKWKGTFENAERINLLGTFAAALSAQGFALVEDYVREETLRGDQRLAGCLDTQPCKLELAERVNADLVLDAVVARDTLPAT